MYEVGLQISSVDVVKMPTYDVPSGHGRSAFQKGKKLPTCHDCHTILVGPRTG